MNERELTNNTVTSTDTAEKYKKYNNAKQELEKIGLNHEQHEAIIKILAEAVGI